MATLLAPTVARAHEVRPALVQITEYPNGRYDFMWKRPTMGEYAVHLVPHLSGGLLDRRPDTIDTTGNYQLAVWRNIAPGGAGLEGRTLSIEGLDQTITDVLVSIQMANGAVVRPALTPDNPALLLKLNAPTGIAVPAYLLLGINHILTGYDHLSFVLGLVLLVSSRSMLIKTVTTFTLAHSVTLALTALHILAVRPALMEALVALSILFVAVELVYAYRKHKSLIARYPWVIALVFGLLHGTAFAGALTEIGLPPNDVPASLLLFNVGVEIGQLLFVSAVLAIGWMIVQLPRELPQWTRWIPPYAIGSLAAFWFIQRIQIAISGAI